LSFGGLALGLVAVGGLGLGVLGIGGLGAGVYAFGGGAIGWRSAGGLAVGWDMACGGGAFAGHAAVGGAAFARDYALGGDARAGHANDETARAVLLDHAFTRFAFTMMGQAQVLRQLAGAGVAPTPGAAPAAAPESFRLDNGLTVKVRPIHGAGNIALLVLYKVGGDHDPEGRSGLAHLVEHLYVTAAAGAAPARTSLAFFQRYPAGCNAQTGDRYTVIATVFPKRDLEKELAEAASRMGELRITAADLEREKPRLLDEVSNMFGRFPALGALNNAREQIRPAPRGGRKGGLPEHVKALTLDEVLVHWQRFYKPQNAIICLAGAVEEAEARQAVSAHFGKLSAGEKVPRPGEPDSPKAGVVRELSVKSLQPNAEPAACLAYAAPAPEDELYAPFLVLVARFWNASAQSGGVGGTDRPSIYFPLLEDASVLGVSAVAKPGETAPQAVARLESFVADTIAPQFREDERASTRQTFAFFLGTAEVSDFALAQNPYGAALSLARREQLAIDPVKLNRALDVVTDGDLRRAAVAILSPDRHAAAFVSPAK
jgi:zinc protease